MNILTVFDAFLIYNFKILNLILEYYGLSDEVGIKVEQGSLNRHVQEQLPLAFEPETRTGFLQTNVYDSRGYPKALCSGFRFIYKCCKSFF